MLAMGEMAQERDANHEHDRWMMESVHRMFTQFTILCFNVRAQENNICTVEPCLTVTSLVRKPPHYSHRGSVPNCIQQCK